VLLIAFAVALGAVVMNWGKGFVEATAKDVSDKSNMDLSCQQDIALSVKEIGGSPIICYTATSLEVMLENSGTKDITGMQFAIFDSTDAMNLSINDSLAIAAGSVSGKLNISHNLLGSITQVEFTPKIKPKGFASSQLCSKNKLVIDDISEC